MIAFSVTHLEKKLTMSHLISVNFTSKQQKFSSIETFLKHPTAANPEEEAWDLNRIPFVR
jgi:hypothetical protein